MKAQILALALLVGFGAVITSSTVVASCCNSCNNCGCNSCGCNSCGCC